MASYKLVGKHNSRKSSHNITILQKRKQSTLVISQLSSFYNSSGVQHFEHRLAFVASHILVVKRCIKLVPELYFPTF